MPNISTLIPDIYELVGGQNGWFDTHLAESFSTSIGVQLASQFNKDPKKPSLRLSQMGPKCPKALWHSIHSPDEAEPLPPWAHIKYTYGHIIEALVIQLAKAAGHEVTGEQDELVVDGIVGHRDCIIDGVLVDVKSAASRSFQKFKDKTIAQDDGFGYLDQLDGYLLGSAHDPRLRIKDRGCLLAVDKTLGHMCLYQHFLRESSIRKRIEEYKRIVGLNKSPKCTCQSVVDGKSGNMKLDMKASYNSFKYSCNPDLRIFLYSDGPRYLTKVIRQPDVLELDRFGKIKHS